MKLVFKLNDVNSEKWNVRLFMSIIILKAANLTFQITALIPEGLEQILFGFVIIFFGISFVYNILGNIRKIDVMTIVLTISLIMMYAYAYFNYPSIADNIKKRFLWTVVFGMSCFWCALKVKDKKTFLKELKPYSYILTILGTIIFFGDTGELTSNMTFSGMMLFPFCLHFYFALKKQKIDIIVCIYELIIIFIHGSRASILNILMFVCLYFCMKGISDPRFIKKLLFLIPVCLVGVILVGTNISGIYNYLLKKGIYVRNLSFLTSGNFFNDNGRDDIQEEYFEKIFNTFPIRFRVVDLFNNENLYPHSVLIEILYNYGYLLGGFILIFIGFSLFDSMLKLKEEQYDLLLILLCAGFFPLLTSFTYFEWPLFWGFLGYLISQQRIVLKSTLKR